MSLVSTLLGFQFLLHGDCHRFIVGCGSFGGAVVAAAWRRQLGSIGSVAAAAVAAWAAAWWR
jgi:hypothetical protein